MRRLFLFSTLALAALQASSAADFAAGLDAYKKGDYVAAMKEWLPLADMGDPGDQFNVGLMYEQGQGVPQSYTEAVKWFRRAAEQDYVKAQHNLGAMYGAGKGVKRDYVQAYKWLNICAGKGDDGCASQRDLLAKKLKPAQLLEAQRQSTAFTPKKESAE